MELSFRASGAGKRAIEHVSALRIEGNVMRDDTGRVVARHRDHQWQLGAAHYFRMDCVGPLMLHFEGSRGGSAVCGPHGMFTIVAGVLFLDRGACGYVDAQRREWHSLRDQLFWPTVVVSPARPGV
jgi:hypothetical protein